MKYLISLILCCFCFSVWSVVDEQKLFDFIHESIDKASYEYQHTNEQGAIDHCGGYLEAMYRILYFIKKPGNDEKIS